MSKQIPLTQGYVAIVDDEDFEGLAQHKWYAHRGHGGDFYAVRKTRDTNGEQRMVRMHRIIVGASPGEDVDHENHDTLDNRRRNIRRCTRAQNQANSRKMRGTSSRFKGVSWHKGMRKWQAGIARNGKSRHLGYFDDEHDAGRAYNAAAIGEFALLNEV